MSGVIKYPLSTEKSIRMMESDNKLVFIVEKKASKKEIKDDVEKTFKVKVEKIRTLIRGNKKYAYIKLNKANPAIDVDGTRFGHAAFAFEYADDFVYFALSERRLNV